MTNDIARILDRDRKELLDLTYRNRLLNVPRNQTRSKTLEIIDEKSDKIFRILVQKGKKMYFLPAPEPDKDEEEDSKQVSYNLLQSDNEELDGLGRAKRHVGLSLQTPHCSERLQKRLLSLYFDARTHQEEQGVNILYLAMGFLRLYEDDESDRARWAPLIFGTSFAG